MTAPSSYKPAAASPASSQTGNQPGKPLGNPQGSTAPGLASGRSAVIADGGRQLLELLTQQQVIYTAITKLAAQQTQLVAKADAQALLTHLGQRQHLVDRLGQINQKLEPYRKDWRSVYDALPADVQTKVTALVDQAQQSLEEIIRQDEADRKQLEQTRQATGQELKHVNKGGMAAAAYGQRAGQPSRLTNHQG